MTLEKALKAPGFISPLKWQPNDFWIFTSNKKFVNRGLKIILKSSKDSSSSKDFSSHFETIARTSCWNNLCCIRSNFEDHAWPRNDALDISFWKLLNLTWGSNMTPKVKILVIFFKLTVLLIWSSWDSNSLKVKNGNRSLILIRNEAFDVRF